MTSYAGAIRGFETVVETFYDRYKRPLSEVAGERLSGVDATEQAVDIAQAFAEMLPGYIAVREEVSLSYEMETLQVSFKSRVEQIRQVAEEKLEPNSEDIRVETFDPDGIMALYRYDRSTDLILVNNHFPYNLGEVRPIQEGEVHDLSTSHNRIEVLPAHQRVLTIQGILRLTEEVAVALQSVPVRIGEITPEALERSTIRAMGIDPSSLL